MTPPHYGQDFNSQRSHSSRPAHLHSGFVVLVKPHVQVFIIVPSSFFSHSYQLDGPAYELNPIVLCRGQSGFPFNSFSSFQTQANHRGTSEKTTCCIRTNSSLFLSALCLTSLGWLERSFMPQSIKLTF